MLSPCSALAQPLAQPFVQPLAQPLVQSLLGPLLRLLAPPPCSALACVCVCAQFVDAWSGQSYRVLAVAMADLPNPANLDLARMSQQQVEDHASRFQLLGLIILNNHINSHSKATVKQLQERWVGLPMWAPCGLSFRGQSCCLDAHVSWSYMNQICILSGSGRGQVNITSVLTQSQAGISQGQSV